MALAPAAARERRPPPATAALVLDDLGCARAGRPLFSGLTLSVAGGQMLRVQGANGAGKTSLLRLICGLLAPLCGRVLWRGRSVAPGREALGSELVFLGHAPALADELSAAENLQVAAALGGFRVARDAAREALAQAGLGGREHVPVRLLSQGQRRRAALARLALARAQPLWVLDEPFNALDAAASAWLCGLVAGHAARGGVVVLTSHQAVDLPPALPQVVLSL